MTNVEQSVRSRLWEMSQRPSLCVWPYLCSITSQHSFLWCGHPCSSTFIFLFEKVNSRSLRHASPRLWIDLPKELHLLMSPCLNFLGLGDRRMIAITTKRPSSTPLTPSVTVIAYQFTIHPSLIQSFSLPLQTQNFYVFHKSSLR